MTDERIGKREESLRIFSQTAKIYDRIGPQIFSYFGQHFRPQEKGHPQAGF